MEQGQPQRQKKEELEGRQAAIEELCDEFGLVDDDDWSADIVDDTNGEYVSMLFDELFDNADDDVAIDEAEEAAEGEVEGMVAMEAAADVG